ncbi:MAG TPA: hypothetical protein VIU61_17530, partial [Kofleriaceae bacterium]
MPDDLDELAGGVGRMFTTARLAGKLGMKAAGRVLRKKPAEAVRESDNRDAIASARKLVAKMSQLKGLVMKAGQIASYMPGTLPPAAQEVLAELQAQSTPMAYQRIAEVLA